MNCELPDIHMEMEQRNTKQAPPDLILDLIEAQTQAQKWHLPSGFDTVRCSGRTRFLLERIVGHIFLFSVIGLCILNFGKVARMA